MVSQNAQISTTQKSLWPLPFFALAFRPFFWLGALFGVVCITAWGLAFTGNIPFTPFGGSFFWHTHEMLFGFSAAIIVGFLLTAVQTWTGVPSIKNITLAILVCVWLLARILLAIPFAIPEIAVILLDLLFLPLASLFLAIPIVKSKNWRNLIFVPALLIMASLNGLMHLSVKGEIALSFISISHSMVLMVALMICLIGGRVIPMFTANGTLTKRVDSLAWLEPLSIGSIMVCIFISFQWLQLPPFIKAGIYFFAGTINFLRAIRWRIWVTLKASLVWSLHLGYWAICIGLFMLGLHELGLLGSESIAFHAITVGGISLMILSMMSRVSLGHTGRKIQANKIIALALGLVVLTFFMRVIAPLLMDSLNVLILISCALWSIAYCIFIVIYCPILFSTLLNN